MFLGGIERDQRHENGLSKVKDSWSETCLSNFKILRVFPYFDILNY